MRPSNINETKQLFASMLRIRQVEETIADRYSQQKMRCPMHLSIGQEAVAVGVSSALEPDDAVFSNHRAHAHYLAKGGDLKAMIAEFHGRSTGCTGGRGGSMHLIDLRAGFLGSTPIVGSTIPVAVGVAWATKLQNLNRVVVAYMGDACFEEGVVHESFIFSALHKLPIVFVCENNGFSVYTRLQERQPERPIHEVARAHGLRSIAADGNDVVLVSSIAREMVEAAKCGGGPCFVELSVHRWREHCGPNFDDHLGYRTPEEVKEGYSQCPIERLKTAMLLAGTISENEVDELQREFTSEIEDAFAFAERSPFPDPSTASDYVMKV